jgi:tripartite-type tricarboxylate transporter receptor subunit TctC
MALMISRRTVLMSGLLAPTVAYAQQYPSRNVSLIVPFAPGASADGIARIIGEELAQLLAKPVVVENRPGAGGTIGLRALAQSAADGYTLGIGATGALVINPHVAESSANFDPLRELAPIAKLIDIPLVLVAHPQAGFGSLKEMIAQSKTRAGGLSYGSTGVNSAQHLAVELLKKATQANLVHVAYRGSAPTMTDVLGGQIPLASVDLTSADPHIKAGAVIPLAVTSSRRLDLAPNIPTIAELAVPNFEVTGWIGLFGPANLSKDVVLLLSEHVRTALARSDVRQRIRQLVCVEAYLDAPSFATFLQTQSARMRDVVRGT